MPDVDKHLVSNRKITLREVLTEEGMNSRLIYLLVNVVVVFCVVALVVASIFKGFGQSTSQQVVLDAFIYLVGVLLAGGASGAAGRWLTNKKAAVQPMESSQRTTVTENIVSKRNLNEEESNEDESVEDEIPTRKKVVKVKRRK